MPTTPYYHPVATRHLNFGARKRPYLVSENSKVNEISAMPPANSPFTTPGDRDHMSEYLERNTDPDDPEITVASTAAHQAQAQADQDNVNFLRRTPPLSGQEREPDINQLANYERQVADYRTALQSYPESARRLRRAVLSMSEYPEAGLQDLLQRLEHETGREQDREREARRHIGYQGWAPGISDNDADEIGLTIGDLRAMAQGHTRPAQDTATRRHIREQELGEARRAATFRRRLEVEQEIWERERIRWREMAGDLTPTQASLRTTALIQSVRRHARFSSRSYNHTGEDSVERDRSNRPETERERLPASRAIRPSTFTRPDPRQDPLDDLRRGISYDLHTGRQRERNNGARASKRTEGSREVEEAIKYLERLRFCKVLSERISIAQASGFMQNGAVAYSDDFLLDTAHIAPPQHSSWLRVGSVFCGNQLSTLSMNIPLQFTNNSRLGVNQNSEGQTLDSLQAHRELWDSTAYNSVAGHISTESVADTWPVKVTINSVDYDAMTLTGTMEAFNVPNKSSPSQPSTIATYLEGEIVDFNRFTLETKSYNANSEVDSVYWRSLEPFKNLTDSEIVHNLVSRKWMTEELGQKWILMRWKEKCFITPTDAPIQLTISGFYYVSLRRDNGTLQAWYFDPTSTPYQHLALGPVKPSFPAYGFR